MTYIDGFGTQSVSREVIITTDCDTKTFVDIDADVLANHFMIPGSTKLLTIS